MAHRSLLDQPSKDEGPNTPSYGGATMRRAAKGALGPRFARGKAIFSTSGTGNRAILGGRLLSVTRKT